MNEREKLTSRPQMSAPPARTTGGRQPCGSGRCGRNSNEHRPAQRHAWSAEGGPSPPVAVPTLPLSTQPQSPSASDSRAGHDFSRIALHAGSRHRQDGQSASRTRNPGDRGGEEDLTSNGESIGSGAVSGAVVGGLIGAIAGPAGAVAGAVSGAAVGAAAAALAGPVCKVATGPTYTPSGTIPVTTSGGRKKATFSMAATFDAKECAPCCEVRQYIKWDAAYEKSKGGPPHSGFPSSSKPGTWYEDRDDRDKRYGHRSGTHSDPIASCGDEYLTGGKRDQAKGDTYCGRDSPGAPASRVGQWQFQLKVIDTSRGGAVRASSSVITLNW